jgi:predicted Zn-dependent protease
MTPKLGSLAIISLLLGACATNTAKLTKTAVPIEKITVEAEADAKRGQVAQALSSLHAAAAAHPTEKLPWLTAAQINFDQGKYGDAIVAALSALERDPHDKLANSLVTVSGLRLSTAALTELVQKDSLSSNTRAEAQELARVLRNNLGEDSSVPAASGKSLARGMRPPERRTTPLPKAAPAAGTDPFATLK